MTASRSVSRNSRTRLMFCLTENTSKSLESQPASGYDMKRLTAMMLGWCSSCKNLTSRSAVMSKPSFISPVLIFFIATDGQLDFVISQRTYSDGPWPSQLLSISDEQLWRSSATYPCRHWRKYLLQSSFASPLYHQHQV